jgi:rod shape-determining protein MreD
MSRIAGSSRDVAMLGFRRQAVPILSTLAASLLDLLPIVAQWPIVPDFAFLVLIGWRLLRPEIWQPHVALGLGLCNDLIAGHPIGQSMAIWTMTFLAFDLLDARTGWRDYWVDWFFASVAIAFHSYGGWFIAKLMGSATLYSVMLPQLAVSVFAYPFVARLIVALDRWRLAR